MESLNYIYWQIEAANREQKWLNVTSAHQLKLMFTTFENQYLEADTLKSRAITEASGNQDQINEAISQHQLIVALWKDLQAKLEQRIMILEMSHQNPQLPDETTRVAPETLLKSSDNVQILSPELVQFTPMSAVQQQPIHKQDKSVLPCHSSEESQVLANSTKHNPLTSSSKQVHPVQPQEARREVGQSASMEHLTAQLKPTMTTTQISQFTNSPTSEVAVVTELIRQIGVSFAQTLMHRSSEFQQQLHQQLQNDIQQFNLEPKDDPQLGSENEPDGEEPDENQDNFFDAPDGAMPHSNHQNQKTNNPPLPEKPKPEYTKFVQEDENPVVSAPSTKSPTVSLKLEALQLPTFDGDLTQWIAFRDQYMDLVHNNPNLTSVIKFHMLKTHLRGLAADAINGFNLSASDYEAAWFVLTKRYDQKDRIIDEYINKFTQIPSLHTNANAAQIINIVNRANQLLRVLPVLGVEVKSWDKWMLLELRKKLDHHTLTKWMDQVKRRENVPLSEFLEFLETEASERVSMTLEHNKPSTSYGTSKVQNKRGNWSGQTKDRQSYRHQQNNPQTMMIAETQSCAQCKGTHPIFRCRTFRALSVIDRIKKSKKLNLCQICLGKHLNMEECKFDNCPTCNKKHNSLLCFTKEKQWRAEKKEKKSDEQNKNRPQKPQAAAQVTNIAASNTKTNKKPKKKTPQVTNVSASRVKEQSNEQTGEARTILGTVVTKLLNANPWNNNVRALLDSGSQLNLITQKAAIKLGLKVDKVKLSMTGAQDRPIGEARGRVTVSIAIPNTSKSFLTTLYVVQKISKNLPCYAPSVKNHMEFKDLELADPSYAKPGEVEALFGVRILMKILEGNIIKTKKGDAMAQKTKLGWVIYQVEPEPDLSPYIATIATKGVPTSLEHLDSTLKQFWELESMPTIKRTSPEEKECERVFVEEHSRSSDGRYIVKLPFNDKINLLGHSKSAAVRQFMAMEKRMTRDKSFHEQYVKFMEEYRELDHMSLSRSPIEDGYYTPHHGVFSSNKFRVVFNASYPSSTGISLNECQLTGEKLQPDLAVTLMNFRRYRVALTADIVKMFRQIEIDPAHRKYQKIIWRSDPSKPLETFELNTVTYGQTAAPHLSVRALQQCAHDYAKEFPIGANHTLNAFYVDDLLTGADSTDEAIEIYNQMTEMLRKGKFELAKWCSNNWHCNNEIGGQPLIREIEDPETKSVLGLRWLPLHDTFGYKLCNFANESEWTKRKILSCIGRLYDPNGFISPVVVTAKIIMQDLWKFEKTWDEPISTTTLQKWTNFVEALPNLETIKIPRWIETTNHSTIILHGFSDASEDAYAAVVYLQIKMKSNKYSTHLLQSKTRVAPLKRQSIPRLELCAAHLLANLVNTTISQLKLEITAIHLWTDSEVTLQWINKDPSGLKTFVGNRVAQIQEKTTEKGAQWHWVPGTENPADLASRGVTPQVLAEKTLWWNGPQWLQFSSESWPMDFELTTGQDEALEEAKLVCLVSPQPSFTRGKWYQNKNSTESNFLQTYGSYDKMERVMAIVLRAIGNFRRLVNQKPRVIGPLQANEKESARLMLIKIDQKESLGREINEALQQTDVEPGNNYYWYQKETGLLRLSGRVLSENLEFDSQYPPILSPGGSLASLLIRKAHQKTLHGGAQQVIQLIREKYWIPKLRRLVRSIINFCPTCFRYRKDFRSQIMAPLPRERTTPEKPFANCGVDYMGPVGLASRTGRNPIITKAYVCVFVCFATRAIHLELVSDASTPQFLQALRRIIARRGRINNIWSDNGTNFVGANNSLQEVYKRQGDWAKESRKVLSINWHFATPNAPHHGGIYEAAVKSTKRHLIRVIGDKNLTFEEFATLLAQTEACVNSRPLTQLSDDPLDLNALTPAHFLIGEPLITLIEPEQFPESPKPYLKRWELVQQMYQHFWKRWHNEYLQTLIDHTKWRSKERNLQIGDLVIIREDNLAPSNWKMGRITQTYPGNDGFVRSVQLKTTVGLYNRPVTKLGLLIPTVEDEPSTNDPSINSSKRQPVPDQFSPMRKRLRPRKQI